MDVSLPPDLERQIAETVATGRYSDASEVVREGLKLLFQTQAARADRVRKLQADIAVGLAELDAGMGIPGEQVLAEVTSRLQARG